MRSGRRVLVVLTGALVLVEAAAAAAAVVVIVVGLLLAGASSVASAAALAVLAAVLCVGLAAAAVALLRGRAWPRAAIVVWQVLQLAVGVSALTGSGSSPYAGWPLIGLAVILIGLVFSPPVVAATQERRERG